MELNEAKQILKNNSFLLEGATYQSFVNWLKAGYDQAVREIEKYYDDGFEVEYMNGAIKESFNELYDMFETGASVDELQKKLEYEYHNY
jgi:DNA-binding ferritin-like protein (Dps family)